MSNLDKILVRLVESALNNKNDLVLAYSKKIQELSFESKPKLSNAISDILKENDNQKGMNINLFDNINTSYIVACGDKYKNKKLLLSDRSEYKLEQISKEQKFRDKLIKNNLEPCRSVLFVGPPGVGKTMSAHWLAHELGLPLLIMDIASIMSSKLGETGNNIKRLLDTASSSPCVLLLDEFDSIAKTRDDESDVGELKRIVTVLLQAMDSWPSTSLLIAATNHPEILDKAIWRRFEEEVWFELPSIGYIEKQLALLVNDKTIINIAPLFKGMSYSDIENHVNRIKKRSIIDDIDFNLHLIDSLSNKIRNQELDLTEKEVINILQWCKSSGMSNKLLSSMFGFTDYKIRKVLSS